jgi:hypothetical protein
MYFHRFLAILTLVSTIYALADQNNGQNDQGKTLTKTTVWVTKTANGKLTTLPLVYEQSFKTTYTEAENSGVKSGAVGLGSQSGNVGQVRSYDRTTILNTNAGVEKTPNLYSGFAGAMLAFVAAVV